MGFPKYFEDDEWIKVSRHTYRPFKIAKTFIGNLDNVSNIFVYDDDNAAIKLTDRLAGYGEKETWETAENGVVAKTFINYTNQPVAAVAEKLATANLSAHAKQVFSMPLKMVFDDEGHHVPAQLFHALLAGRGDQVEFLFPTQRFGNRFGFGFGFGLVHQVNLVEN